MFDKYPYTDFSQINLDWLMSKYNELSENYDSIKATVAAIKAQLDDVNANIDAAVRAYFQAMTQEQLEAIVSGALGQKAHLVCLSSGDAENLLGSCLILYNDDGEAILIDTGSQSSGTILLTKLAAIGVDTIKSVIISHWHGDHCNALQAVLDSTAIDTSDAILYAPHGALDTSQVVGYDAEGSNWPSYIARQNAYDDAFMNLGGTVYPTENMITYFGGIKIKFNNCSADKFSGYYNYTLNENLNDDGITNYNCFSMLITLDYAYHRFVYTADQEGPSCEANADVILGAEYITVNHHGLDEYEPPAWLAAVSSTVAINTAYGSANARRMADGAPMNARCRDTGCLISTATQSAEITLAPWGFSMEAGAVNGMEPINPLYVGEQIPKNADLDAYTQAGVYTSQNAEVSATLANSPFSSSGFKLMVIMGSHGRTYLQMAISLNTIRPRIAIRDISGSHRYTWHYAFLGEELLQTSLDEAEHHANITFDAGEYSRVAVRNGVCTCALRFAISDTIAGNSVLASVPFPVDLPQTIFPLMDSSGNIYPCRIRDTGGNIVLENLVALERTGIKYYGFVTCLL